MDQYSLDKVCDKQDCSKQHSNEERAVEECEKQPGYTVKSS